MTLIMFDVAANNDKLKSETVTSLSSVNISIIEKKPKE